MDLNLHMENNLGEEYSSKSWFGIKVPKKIKRIGIILIFIAIIINLAVLAISVGKSYIKYGLSDSYASKIIEIDMTKNTFTTEESNGRRRPVFISQDTKILKGEKVFMEKNLKVGDYVFITGTSIHPEKFEASMIRVFDNKSKTLLPESFRSSK